jgi:glycosyltransferase involved in cell wall biosynthesis
VNIVYIAKALIPSRTANSLHVMKMCQAFADNGHTVLLLVLSEQKNTVDKLEKVYEQYAVKGDFHIVWVPVMETRGSRMRYLLSSFLLTGSLVRRILLAKPDLVFGRDLLGCTVSALLGKKTIYESHFPLWYGKLEAFLFRILLTLPRFSKLVVISEALRTVYIDRYLRLNDANTLVAHDAADVVSSKTLASRPFSCREIGRKGHLNVGYVGHLYKGKGVEVIEKLAPRLPEVDFHIIGGLEQDILHWKSRINVANVTFHGFVAQDQLPSYIQSLDVCLLPNQRHVSAYGASTERSKNISSFTSPLKMFEYMAYQKPIVASDLPVLREVLNDEVAILVPPDDIDAWQQAIERLFDEKLRDKLGSNGNALFMENFTWIKRAENVLLG